MFNEAIKKNKTQSVEIAEAKRNARSAAKQSIKSLSLDYKRESAQKIQTHIHDLFIKLNIIKSHQKTWAAFHALPSEPSLLWKQIDENATWCFPETKDEKLYFITSDNQVKSLSEIDGVFVPALAFNANGARLGRGMGFYDKTLNGYQGLKIGITYDCNVSTEIPYESHDVKMNYIVTENRILDGVDHHVDQKDRKSKEI